MIALPAMLLAMVSLALIVTGNLNGRGAFDQINYHEPAIRTFASQLPEPDVSDYLSATTPGYHLALAGVARTLSDSKTALRLTGLVFSVVLVLLCARWITKRTDVSAAIWLSLPFASSLYVVSSAAWLLPDNAGWLGVACVIMLALSDLKLVHRLVFASTVLVLLVCVRQIHIWVAACVWASAWMHAAPVSTPTNALQSMAPPLNHAGRRITHAILAIAASAPAFGALLWFKHVWNGHLTPPTFVNYHNSGLNPSALAFMLAVVALFSIPFAPVLWPQLKAIATNHRTPLAFLFCVAVVVAVVAPTSYSENAGRFSGIWNIAEKLPAPANRSMLIVPLAIAGSFALICWLSIVGTTERWILAGAFIAYAAAMTASFQVWQRYVEPFSLLFLLFVCTYALLNRPNARHHIIRGSVVLAMIMCAITTGKLVKSKQAELLDDPTPWLRAEQPSPILSVSEGPEDSDQ